MRPPFCPRIPVEIADRSENASSGRWQLAQETVPSVDSRLSKKSHRPRRTRSGVGGSFKSVSLPSMPSGGAGSGTIGFASYYYGQNSILYGGGHPNTTMVRIEEEEY